MVVENKLIEITRTLPSLCEPAPKIALIVLETRPKTLHLINMIKKLQQFDNECQSHRQFHRCLFTLYHLQFVQQSKDHYTKGRFRA